MLKTRAIIEDAKKRQDSGSKVLEEVDLFESHKKDIERFRVRAGGFHIELFSRGKMWGTIVVFVLWLSYFAMMMCLVSFDTSAQYMAKDKALSDSMYDERNSVWKFRSIGLIANVVYISGKFMNGLIMDLSGGVSTATHFWLSLTGACIVTLFFGMGEDYWTFAMTWAINAVFHSSVHILSLKVMNSWFSSRRYGTVIGIFSSATRLAIVIGLVLNIALLEWVESCSWRHVFFVNSVVLLFSIAVSICWFRTGPREVRLRFPVDGLQASAEERRREKWARNDKQREQKEWRRMLLRRAVERDRKDRRRQRMEKKDKKKRKQQRRTAEDGRRRTVVVREEGDQEFLTGSESEISSFSYVSEHESGSSESVSQDETIEAEIMQSGLEELLEYRKLHPKVEPGWNAVEDEVTELSVEKEEEDDELQAPARDEMGEIIMQYQRSLSFSGYQARTDGDHASLYRISNLDSIGSLGSTTETKDRVSIEQNRYHYVHSFLLSPRFWIICFVNLSVTPLLTLQPFSTHILMDLYPGLSHARAQMSTSVFAFGCALSTLFGGLLFDYAPKILIVCHYHVFLVMNVVVFALWWICSSLGAPLGVSILFLFLQGCSTAAVVYVPIDIFALSFGSKFRFFGLLIGIIDAAGLVGEFLYLGASYAFFDAYGHHSFFLSYLVLTIFAMLTMGAFVVFEAYLRDDAVFRSKRSEKMKRKRLRQKQKEERAILRRRLENAEREREKQEQVYALVERGSASDSPPSSDGEGAPDNVPFVVDVPYIAAPTQGEDDSIQ